MLVRHRVQRHSDAPRRPVQLVQDGAGEDQCQLTLPKPLEQPARRRPELLVLAAAEHRGVDVHPAGPSLGRTGRHAADDLCQQALGLGLQRQDVRLDLRQRPHWLGLVEVAVEADLVAGLHTLGVVPRVGGVGQDLPAQERLDAALLLERDLLRVAETRVRLVLDDSGPAVDLRFEQAAQRVRGDASLVDLPDQGRGSLASTADGLEFAGFGGLVHPADSMPSMRSGRSTVTFQ